MIPQSFEGYWPAPLYPYDSQLARQLLAEAGYPNGFDAGMISVDMANASFAEAVAGYWGAVGIRATLRPQERAALVAWLWREEDEAWDEQIRSDHRAGKLDKLVERAEKEFDDGTIREAP